VALARAIERYFDEDLSERFRAGVARDRRRFEWDSLVDAIESVVAECLR
jgi:hypothetical protein